MSRRQRIAIIGGGMAALTAAYYLSSTQRLRDRYEVTVHQMGWRLGGKCASGRDEHNRIIEHGLHVWFGCYDNAFGLMRRVYDDWGLGQQARPTLDDVFMPRNHSRIGHFNALGGEWQEVPWPELPGKPWDGNRQWSLHPWNVVAEAIRHLNRLVSNRAAPHSMEIPQSARMSSTSISECARQAGVPTARMEAVPTGGAAEIRQSVGTYLDIAAGLASANVHSNVANQVARADAIRDLVGSACETASRHPRVASESFLPAGFIDDTLEIIRAYIVGFIDDLLLGSETIDTLDRFDFRKWLIDKGASPSTVDRSRAVRALYDTMFQYVDGNPVKPDFAAGTASQVVARLVATYRGSFLYLVQRGMGEVVVGPLYEVLVQQGVKFSFFDKAVALEADADGSRIDKIRFQRQAKLRNDTYQPVKHADGFPYWPDQPDWDQLDEGDRLKSSGVDFESHWNTEPPVREFELKIGTDFDIAVLGVSIGAMKSFGRPAGMVASLQQANQRFSDMVEGFELIPSQAAQLWFSRSTQQLGQAGPPHAAVSGPEPFDIYADMGHLIRHEGWTDGNRPASLYYMCSVYDSRAFTVPPQQTAPTGAALMDVKNLLQRWIDEFGTAIWPGAAQPDGKFDYTFISSLYVRVNINPTDCCPSSATGTTRVRLASGDSGFANLFLAGCWTRTGLNTTCVESAVMSGMQAARAISGSPSEVIGEDFLRGPAGLPLPAASLDCLGNLLRRFSPFMHAFGLPERDDSNSGRPEGNAIGHV